MQNAERSVLLAVGVGELKPGPLGSAVGGAFVPLLGPALLSVVVVVVVASCFWNWSTALELRAIT
jgi:hypothetical protein